MANKNTICEKEGHQFRILRFYPEWKRKEEGIVTSSNGTVYYKRPSEPPDANYICAFCLKCGMAVYIKTTKPE